MNPLRSKLLFSSTSSLFRKDASISPNLSTKFHPLPSLLEAKPIESTVRGISMSSRRGIRKWDHNQGKGDELEEELRKMEEEFQKELKRLEKESERRLILARRRLRDGSSSFGVGLYAVPLSALVVIFGIATGAISTASWVALGSTAAAAGMAAGFIAEKMEESGKKTKNIKMKRK